MDSQTRLILFIGAIILVGVILTSIKTTKKKKPLKFITLYSPNGLTYIQKLEELFNTNQTTDFTGVKPYEDLFGPLLGDNKIEELEKAVGIHGFLNYPEDSDENKAYSYYQDLVGALSQRAFYEEQGFSFSEAETMERWGLNIFKDEIVTFTAKDIDWYEEKVIGANISYGGFRYRMGKGAIGYSTGNLTYIREAITQFVAIDRGRLFLTNKRLIFVGENKGVNKTIKLDSILEFSIFKDGILLGKTNGKKPLISTPDYINTLVPRDTLNQLTRALNKALAPSQLISES